MRVGFGSGDPWGQSVGWIMGDSAGAVQAYLKVLSHERQLSEHTVGAYRRDLQDLQTFLTEYLGTPEWQWEEVDRLSLRSFLGWCLRRGLSKRTIGRKLSSVRGFFRFLHLEERVPANPARAVRAQMPISWAPSRPRMGPCVR